jgi:hypothetical protein
VRSVSAGEISLLSRDEPNSVVSPEEPPCQDSPDVADSNEEASSEEAAAAVDLLEAERVKKKEYVKKKMVWRQLRWTSSKLRAEQVVSRCAYERVCDFFSKKKMSTSSR